MPGSTSSGGDERLSIALDRSWGAVEAQRERLDGFRGRATGLLGTVSVIVGVGAAVGGTETFDASDGFVGFTIGAFCLAVAAALFIVWPRNWRFTSEPSSMEWFFHNATAEQMRNKLYRDAVRDFRENGKNLRLIEWAITFETAAVGITAVSMLLTFARS